jgi:DedD protein
MMEDFKKDIDDYFCRFTFGQFVTLILIEVVTLFFVFYLGARYGTDLLGTGEPQKEAVVPAQSPKNVDDIVGAPPVEYTYPEVLTSRDGQKAIRIKPSGMTADEYEKQKVEDPAAIIQRDTPQEEKQQVPKAPQTPPPAKPEEKPAEKPAEKPIAKPTEEPSAEEQLAKEEGPVKETAPEKETPPEEAAPAPKPKGKFAIQVGSYQSNEEALVSLSAWKKKGYSAYTAVGQVPQKGTWYRVRIGGFATHDEAQKFLEKFKAKEKASALVVLSNS